MFKKEKQIEKKLRDFRLIRHVEGGGEFGMKRHRIREESRLDSFLRVY